MRLSLTTLFAFTLSFFPFFSSQVSAIHPQVLSRRENPSPSLILSSRQHRVLRSILDLCINVNVDLLANASQHGPASGPLDLGSNIHLCLCLKDLNIFLDTNVDIKALIGILGKNTVSALITALINTSPDASQCTIPLHAHRTCNSRDPCHYECDPHYVRVGDMCVCAPPYTSCNGDCNFFPKGCGTAVPRSFKARNAPITTFTQAKAICKPHETVCGIPGRENSFDFECIDVNIAGDSCGGCMTPHPFPQADYVLHVLGTDCTRIPNAKNSECFERRCIVSKCNPGCHPSLSRDTCIPDANTNIGSDLVAKIGAIVNLVSGLEYTPSQISADPSSLAAVIPDLLGGVNNATSRLIASTDVPSLLNNLDALLNVSSVVSSTLSSCDCGRDSGLTDLEDALGNILAGLLNLKSWCTHNVPSDLNLSGLLSGLGLNNPTVAAVVRSDLVDQIKSFVELVVGLAGVSSSLHPPPSPSNLSSINTDITNSIVNATIHILNATTVSSLVSSIGALVNANGLAGSLLDHCGCVSALGLEIFVAYLAQVAKAALRMQDWCNTYPIANISGSGSSSPGASTSNSNMDEVSVDLGLSNLLGLLGTGAAIRVSGSTTNTLVNGLSGGLPGGLLLSTGDVRRQLTADADASVRSELLTKIEDLVRTLTLTPVGVALPAPSVPQTSTSVIDSSVIDNVLRASKDLLHVSSLATIKPEVNRLVSASLASVKTLDSCGCVDNLGLAATYESLVQISKASLDLQDWCHSHSMLVSPSPSSSHVNSKSYGQPSRTTTNAVKVPIIVEI